MKRILFVDDEPNVLNGLRDLLRKQRKHWEMVFAASGEQALLELSRASFDVVVSDMRMPGVDGVALLAQVKQAQPAAARIILSGQAERQSVIAALPVSHQFLSKPCDAEALIGAIERASNLQSLLSDERLRDVVGAVDRLPTAPRVYWELVEAMAQPATHLSDLAAIVERDAAMAAKVLQLVSSSYFGIAHRPTSVAQAVGYLGADLLKTLALGLHVFSPPAPPAVPGFSLEALQQHSLLVARIAKRFLRDKAQGAEAFLTALIHDLGKIVLAISIPDRYAEVVAEAARSKRPDHVVEAELLGVTHAEVGAYLLGLWGLPIDVVEAVARHHRPELGAPTSTLMAVHAADALSYPANELGEILNVAAVERSDWGPELPRWREIAAEELRLAVSA